MSEKYREAFEAKASFSYDITRREDGHYANRDTEAAWIGWQGACDHYAPKQIDTRTLEGSLATEFRSLQPDEDDDAWDVTDFAIEAIRFLRPYMLSHQLTEKEAIEAAAKAIDHVSQPQINAFDDKIRGLYIANADECAKAAFRAAGVRFKEEG